MAISAPTVRASTASQTDETSHVIDTSGVTDGELAVIIVQAAGGASIDPGAISVDNSFTKYNEQTEAYNRIAIFYKEVTGSESNVTASWTESGKCVIHCVEWPGVDHSTPMEGFYALNHSSSSDQYTTGTGAATATDRWAMTIAWSRSSSGSGQAFTADAAQTERADLESVAGSSPYAAMAIFDGNGTIGDTSNHSYTATGARAESHGGGVLVYMIPGGAGATTEQATFAFGLDNGTEAAHTIGTQDADVTAPVGTKTLRFGIQATGDPSATAWKLQHQVDSGGYGDTPIGGSTSPTLSSITAGSVDYSSSGGGTVDPVYPTIANANDAIILIVGQKPATANGGGVTTPSGFTLQGSLTGAGGYGETLAADTGNTNIFVYSKDTVTGSEDGTTLSVSLTDNNVAWGILITIPTNAEHTWSYAVGTGSDTSAGSVSIATGNMAISSGDLVIGAMVIPTDVSTPNQFSAEAFSQSGTTFGTVTEIIEPDTNVGMDMGGFLCWALATAGSGTGAVTMTATAGGTTTNVRGPGAVVRIRVTGVTRSVYITPSTNVAAGGEATSSRLTGLTGSFTTGRRWDDENGTDTIDIGTDGNTEIEWVIATSGLSDTQTVDFRLTPITTITESPRWTIGAGGTNAPAQVASGSGTATAPTRSVKATAGTAQATGTATNATGKGERQAPAQVASGTGTASGATTKVSAKPTVASATGTATNATPTAGGNANAQVAQATGTASNATPKASGNAQPTTASATGTATDADISTVTPPPTFGAAGTQIVGYGITANFPVPSGTAAGEVVACILYIESTMALTPPTGFELLDRFSTSDHDLVIWWKRCTGTDTGTYDVDLGESLIWREGIAIRYSGAAASGNPWNFTDGATTDNTTNGVTPAVAGTTTTPTLDIWVGTNYGQGSWTPPTDYTERLDSSQNLSVADWSDTSVGATGDITGTCTGTNVSSIGWLGALASVVAATDVDAGSASGTGTASNATTTSSGNADAEVASATGAATNATTTVSTNAQATVATATGTATNPTITASGNAQPTTASATGTTSNATTTASTNAQPGTASATGSAVNASSKVSATAQVAQATGTASNATTTASADAEPTPATASGSAHDAEAATGTRALAVVAQATGVASNPTISTSTEVEPTAAQAAGSASNAHGAVGSGAGSSAGSGTATNPTITTSGNATPTAAQATGTAHNATITATGTANAPAQVASAAGAAHNPTTTAATRAGAQTAQATGTGSGPGGAGAINPTQATSVGAAHDATVTAEAVTQAQAGAATATGSAHDPTVIFARLAQAEGAFAVAVAANAVVYAVSPGQAMAEVATARGAAYGVDRRPIFVGGVPVLLEPQQLTLITPAEGGPDGFGNATWDYGPAATRRTFMGWIQQDQRAEGFIPGRDPKEEQWLLITNEADLTAQDRIEWTAAPQGPVIFEIEGPVEPVYRPSSGFHHSEATLRILVG